MYQALSDECAPNRNNDAIFNKAGYLVMVNFLLNAAWSPIFQQNNLYAFIVALVICIGMLGTAVFVLGVSLENRLSPTGIIGMRIGFALYSGWLSVATTLNIGFVLKAGGLSSVEANIDESSWAVYTLIAVFCVYALVTFLQRNPAYALVLEWALVAIMVEQATYPNVVICCWVLLAVNGCYIIGISVWLGLDKSNNYPKEMTGLFY